MTQNRNELLSINPVFTTHLLHYQDLKYNPQTALFKEGDTITLRGTTEVATLSNEHAAKLNQENIDYFKTNQDKHPFESFSQPAFVGEIGLKSNKTTKDGYLLDLAQSLEGLRIALRQKDVLFLADWPTPWLSCDSSYEPVKLAINYLQSKIDPAFVGGFKLSDSEINSFIPPLFWLIRCHASFPTVRFAFNDSSTVFSLCKYGIIHADFYDEKEQDFVLGFFEKRGFEEIEFCSDPVDFT